MKVRNGMGGGTEGGRGPRVEGNRVRPRRTGLFLVPCILPPFFLFAKRYLFSLEAEVENQATPRATQKSIYKERYSRLYVVNFIQCRGTFF